MGVGSQGGTAPRCDIHVSLCPPRVAVTLANAAVLTTEGQEAVGTTESKAERSEEAMALSMNQYPFVGLIKS